MASEKCAEDCFSITWTIHNFSYCWQKTGEALTSPSFCVNESAVTKWKLLLFPRGLEKPRRITIRLSNEKDSVDLPSVNFDIQIVASDGCVVNMPKVFRRYQYFTICRADITEGIKYLPQDILTIRCRTNSLVNTSRTQQLFAQTIINVEKIPLQSSVEKFGNWEPQQAQPLLIKYESKHIIMPIELFLSINNKTDILVNISTFKKCTNYFKLKAFILDYKKNKVDSGEWESWLDNGKSSNFTLKFTKDDIIRNESLYLPNGVLTLFFEITTSTGHYTSLPTPNVETENWRKYIAHEKIFDYPYPLITDLTSLQKDHSTCDMKLKTKTNVFPVHTLILGARYPVFKAMFSSKMKETVNGCVDVSDLDDETVRRFLLYLYTNQMEDL